MNRSAKVLARAKTPAGFSEVVTLSTGVRVRLQPVSSILIEECRASIEPPEPPTIWIEEKQRFEENPNDPVYLAALRRHEVDVARATIDALILFGVELVDPLPDMTEIIKKLRLLEKGGLLDLSILDLDDELDRTFLYLRYVAFAGADLALLSGLHGVNPEGVSRARRSFLGDEAGDSDRGVSSPDGSGDPY